MPQPIKDTVDSWSTRKKVAVASAIIASLAAIYNREAIMNLVKDMLDVEPQRKIFHNTDNMIYKLRDLKQYLTPYLNPLSNSFDEKEAQALARDLSSINPSVLLEDLETMVMYWPHFIGDQKTVWNRLNKNPDVRLPQTLRSSPTNVCWPYSQPYIRALVITLQKLAPKELR